MTALLPRFAVAALALVPGPVAVCAGGPVLAKVELTGPIDALGLPVRAHLLDEGGKAFALVVAPRERLDAAGVRYQVLDPDAGSARYGLAVQHASGRSAVPAGPRLVRVGPGGTDDGRREGEQVISIDEDLVLAPPGTAPVPVPAARDDRVAGIIGRIRTEDLTGWEARLTGEEPAIVGGVAVTITSRNTRSGPQIAAATQFVLEELSAMGLAVRFHDWVYALTANRNVVAELPGGARAREIVLMTAHLDDMPVGGPAPGADDNASGVAALLSAAKVLKDYRFDRTIRFVAMTGEEQGLYGSKQYAALVRDGGENVVAVLNLDMIGWDSKGGPTLNLHTRIEGNPGYPADLSIANLFQDVVSWYGLSSALTPRVVADGVLGSDHSPFWSAGIPAILGIEDDLDDLDPAYHSTYDRLSHLNLDYLTNFVRASVGTVAHLASPAGSDRGAVRSFFVPSVLSLAGAKGSYYTSELAFTNHGSTAATVTFSYTATIGGGSGTVSEALPAGSQRIVPDVLEYLRSRGLAIADAGSKIGTLRVTFEGLSNPSDAAVLIRTTTPVAPGPETVTGRAGLAFGGVPVEGLPVGPVVLAALREDDADRSSVAVQNAGEAGGGDVTLRLTFFPADGSAASGPVEATLPPGGFAQYRLAELAGAGGGKNGYVKVERTIGSSPWFAYGVINDNVTSDGSFVAPVPLSSPLPAVLPVVVEGGTYTTEATLTNVSGREQDLLLTFSAQAVLTPTKSASMALHLGSGEQKVIPNLVGAFRDSGAPGFIGMNPLAFIGSLLVAADGAADGILVNGRTLNPADPSRPAAGRFGVAYGGVPSGKASDGPVWISGLRQDEGKRTNLAVVNTGSRDGKQISVKIEIFDGETGKKSGEFLETVPPHQVVQVDSILLSVPDAPRQGYARITRISGIDPFIAYAVINDGGAPGAGSGDGAYLAPDGGY